MLRILFAAAVAILSFSVGLTSAHAETMKACSIPDGEKPANCGELWAVSAQINIPATNQIINTPNPSCGDGSVFDYAGILKTHLSQYLSGEKTNLFSADLINASVHYGAVTLHQQTGGDITAFLWRNMSEKTDKGNCQTLAVLVPQNAKVKGYRLLMGEAGGPLAPCVVGIDCIGWGRFLREPITATREGDTRAFMTTAMNWSDNRERTAKLYIFYQMPPGEDVIVRM